MTMTYFGVFFFFQAEAGIRDYKVTGVQTCALPISSAILRAASRASTTSVPVAIRIRSGDDDDSHRVYAPRSTSDAGARSVRSSVGTFWRENDSATGPSVRSSATRQAAAVSFAS